MKLKALIPLLLTLVISTYAGNRSKDNVVLASVGGHKITMGDFTARYEDYLIYSGVKDNVPLRFSILNNMINEILLKDYDNNSKIYNNSEYQKELKWTKDEVILAYLKDQEVYSKITATENELHKAFERTNIKLEVRHLYAPTKKAADELYALLKMGVDFNKLAKQVFTDSLLRNNGGYLGYISWGSTDPNFEEAAYSLKVGEISKPVKTAKGYSIIKLENRVVNPMMTEYSYLNMKPKLERAVKISKKSSYEKAYLAKIFGKNTIKFNDQTISNIYKELEQTETLSVENENGSKASTEFCVEYQGKKYSKNEILAMLFSSPQYSLEKIKSVKALEAAVLGLLMQEKLLSIAKRKGYDNKIDVTTKYNELAKNIFLNYKRKEILKTVDVSDSELYSFYNKNISYFKEENEMNVQEIVVQDSSLLGMIRNKLEAGENFGKLAEEYSLRKWSSKNKGILGLSPVSKFGELKDTLWDSPLGKVVGPLKFDKYTGFFKVLKKQDGKPVAFKFVKAKILNAVRNEKGFPYMKKHLEKLSKKTDIKVNDKLLANYNFNLAG
ncbi:MAG TPA: peptidylprolyl isomerase [Ignavibacteriaceae bacterium]|nr:peptidylprolyl isomerase [Ignavibacteriaceae bacterium]